MWWLCPTCNSKNDTRTQKRCFCGCRYGEVKHYAKHGNEEIAEEKKWVILELFDGLKNDRKIILEFFLIVVSGGICLSLIILGLYSSKFRLAPGGTYEYEISNYRKIANVKTLPVSGKNDWCKPDIIYGEILHSEPRTYQTWAVTPGPAILGGGQKLHKVGDPFTSTHTETTNDILVLKASYSNNIILDYGIVEYE